MIVPPGKHVLPPLPYSYSALEPVISSTTLHFHHDYHHKSYVDNLNKTELKLVELRNQKNFELIKYWENELAFNGSGHILHSIYWTIMTSIGMGGQPSLHFLNLINNDFGSFNSLKDHFNNAAINVEASGWVILAWQPVWQRLEILQCEKHQNLTEWSVIPILVMDVWEHAYYLDYQNRRKEYVTAWWQLINLPEVEKRLILAMKAQVPLNLNNL